MRILIKRPNGRRKSYSIYEQIEIEGKTQNKTLDLPELQIININLEKEIITKDQAEKNVKELVKHLKLRKGICGPVIHNTDNEKILKEYWEREYSERNLIDPDTAKKELERSVRALGNISLISAEVKDVVKEINKQKWNNTKKRRVLGKIQLLLRFLGRNEKLQKPPKEQPNVTYINEEDFLKTLKKVEDRHLHTLYHTLFYTGMRLGEAFGLSEIKLRYQQEFIIVDTQLDDEGNLRLPKNRKKRKSFVSSKAFPVIKEWLSLKSSYPYSRTVTNKYFKRIFGRHLTLHDLRHSYAIMLLSKGVPMAHVAQSIGDSIKVCEEYYTGFELVDESLETIRKIMR